MPPAYKQASCYPGSYFERRSKAKQRRLLCRVLLSLILGLMADIVSRQPPRTLPDDHQHNAFTETASQELRDSLTVHAQPVLSVV